MNNNNKIVLNLIGLRCPEPIMVIRKTLRNAKNDDKILVLSDDFSTTRDIPKLCYFMKHKLLKLNIKIKPYSFVLQKKTISN